MFGQLSWSRVRSHNVCVSCLTTQIRRDPMRPKTRRIGSSARRKTHAARVINSDLPYSDPLGYDVEFASQNSVPAKGSRPEARKRSQPSASPTANSQKPVKMVKKSKHEGVIAAAAIIDSSRNPRLSSGEAGDFEVVKTSEGKEAATSPSILKKKRKKASGPPSDHNVMRTVSSKDNSPVRKVVTSLNTTKSTKTKTLESKKVLARKNHIKTSGTAGIQRLLTKRQILRLNEQGGLSDADKLQVMEHLRRSMEDKALAEVVSFTKRKNDPTIIFRAVRRTGSRTPRRKAQDVANPGDRRTHNPPASPIEPPISPIKQSATLTAYDIQTIEAHKLSLTPLEKPQPPVPKLSYGLERVLFNPGVYHLRDPRSRVFNFDPYLQSIMPIRDFDFSALKEYITSSRDRTLISTAEAENKKYSGSTSSMTSALAHFHFLLSQWRPINTSTLSQGFPSDYQTFTALQRAPSAIFLRWRDGTYAIDADKQFDTANVLMMLGKSMEKLLTLPTEEFEKYRKQNSSQISEDERNESESYHYTIMGDFLMRSQLDAYDPRLPGTGMFDLKTRAVVSIRMDAQNYERGLGYEIRNRHGEFESYEREYYDMIRSAFLKYSLQVRMGRMDGIFVAFHNIERIFGFQYISLPEMDFALHGTDDTTIGDTEFKISLELLNRILDRATSKYPEQSLRLHFETRPGLSPFMYIFAEPLSENEIEEIQASNKAEIAQFERQALGLDRTEDEDEAKVEWGALQANVEREMENDELGVEDQSESSVNLGRPKNLSTHDDEIERRVNKMLSGMNSDEGEEDDEEDEDEAEDVEEDEEILLGDLNAEESSSELADETRDSHAFSDFLLQHRQGEISTTEAADKGGAGTDQVEDSEKTDLKNSGNVPETDQEVDLVGNVVNEIAIEDEEFGKPVGAAVKSGIVGEDEEANGPSCEVVDLPSNLDHSPAFKEPKELLTMTLTIRNKVNGRYVSRPTNITSDDEWDVEYALAEVPRIEKARSLYRASQTRREKSLASKSKENDSFVSRYMETLHRLSRKGRKWREEQDQIDVTEHFKVLPDLETSVEDIDPK